MKRGKRIITESERQSDLIKRQQAIIESFGKEFNKIKRINESMGEVETVEVNGLKVNVADMTIFYKGLFSTTDEGFVLSVYRVDDVYREDKPLFRIEFDSEWLNRTSDCEFWETNYRWEGTICGLNQVRDQIKKGLPSYGYDKMTEYNEGDDEDYESLEDYERRKSGGEDENDRYESDKNDMIREMEPIQNDNIIDWQEMDGETMIIQTQDGIDKYFYEPSDVEMSMGYNGGSDDKTSILHYVNADKTKRALVKAFTPTGNPDNPEFEIDDVIRIEDIGGGMMQEQDDEYSYLTDPSYSDEEREEETAHRVKHVAKHKKSILKAVPMFNELVAKAIDGLGYPMKFKVDPSVSDMDEIYPIEVDGDILTLSYGDYDEEYDLNNYDHYGDGSSWDGGLLYWFKRLLGLLKKGVKNLEAGQNYYKFYIVNMDTNEILYTGMDKDFTIGELSSYRDEGNVKVLSMKQIQSLGLEPVNVGG